MKILKNRLFIFLLGGIIFSAITAVAVTSITADDVSYDENTTVKDKIDDLYTTATATISNLETSLNNLNSITFDIRGGAVTKDYSTQVQLPDIRPLKDKYKYFKIISVTGNNATGCTSSDLIGYIDGQVSISLNMQYETAVYRGLWASFKSTANNSWGYCTIKVQLYN